MEVRLGTALTLKATGTRVITLGSKFHVQIGIKIHASAGFVKLWIDDSATPDIDFSGDTTVSSLTDTTDYFFGCASVAGSMYFDDLIFNDTDNSDGAGETNKPGIFYFALQNPDGAGNYDSQFTQSSGSSSRYTYVDEGAPANSDTDYLVSVTTGHRQSVTTADITLPSNAVAVAQMTEWITRITGGGYQAIPFNRLSSTDDDGSAQALTTSYSLVRRRITTKPGGGAWTQSDYNNNEIGIKVG
jgi:hypothetical protein